MVVLGLASPSESVKFMHLENCKLEHKNLGDFLSMQIISYCKLMYVFALYITIKKITITILTPRVFLFIILIATCKGVKQSRV